VYRKKINKPKREAYQAARDSEPWWAKDTVTVKPVLARSGLGEVGRGSGTVNNGLMALNVALPTTDQQRYQKYQYRAGDWQKRAPRSVRLWPKWLNCRPRTLP
jgi:hypothetical protein